MNKFKIYSALESALLVAIAVGFLLLLLATIETTRRAIRYSKLVQQPDVGWPLVEASAKSGYDAASLGLPWGDYSNALYLTWRTNR